MNVVKPKTQFPFLFGGTFIEGVYGTHESKGNNRRFPFLFGGTFIEGQLLQVDDKRAHNFPSFSEGLSLRAQEVLVAENARGRVFPFLFGGTFIEGG